MTQKWILVPPGQPPPTTHIEFDFIVAERPRYIPGSGPPLAPITIMPPKSKDKALNGYIIGEVDVFSSVHYLVEHRHDANFRVAVRLKEILNWVSPWELEEYNNNKFDAETEEQKALLEAKKTKLKKKDEKEARFDLPPETSGKRKRATSVQTPAKVKKANTNGLGANKSPGRPRGPRNRNQPVEEEELTFTSPKQSQHSQQQPSLSALGGLTNRTVLDITDTDDVDDDEDTEMALESQLNGGRLPKSTLLLSRSASPPTTSKRSARSRSISKLVSTSQEESRSPSASILPPKRSRKQPSSVSPNKASVAAISSRQALQDLEELERKNGKKSQTIVEKYTHKKTNQIQPGTFQGAHAHLPPPSRGLAQIDNGEASEPVQVDEEPEYEVRMILDHEIRFRKNGTPDKWYWIQWVGDWDNTWEPEENVGAGAIEEYEAKLKQKKKRVRGGDGDNSDPDSLFIRDNKGKGKEIQRGQLIDEDGDDEDENEWQAFGVSA